MSTISPLFDVALAAGVLFVLSGQLFRNVSHMAFGSVLALVGFTGGLLLGGGWFPAWVNWFLIGWTVFADTTVWLFAARIRATRAG
ncbi:hypothetical protein AB0393_38745 [Streptomyces cyaneofuscatus]|uniref:hypothetical protein n=1 Tax=Streptomyces cyaneofuscatus TaxID=66883 RepID=UPI00344F1C66